MQASSQDKSQFSGLLGSSLCMWGPNGRLFDRITPRYLSWSVDFRMTPHNISKYVRSFRLLIFKGWHYQSLETMPQSAAQCSKFRIFIGEDDQEQVSWWTWDGRSLMHRMNSRDPMTVTWGSVHANDRHRRWCCLLLPGGACKYGPKRHVWRSMIWGYFS